MKNRRGIDVSLYQGRIDWRAVAKCGIDFAIIKCSQGGFTNTLSVTPFTDRRFIENILGAYDAGIAVGVYHFLTGTDREKVKKEAEYVISLLSRYRNKISLPVAVDFEAERYKRLSRKTNSELILTFAKTIEKAGYECMLYTNRNFMKYYINADAIGNMPLWFALYRNPESDKRPPIDFENIVFWQWAQKGRVPGISDDVCLDIAYDDSFFAKIKPGSRVRIKPDALYYYEDGARIPGWVKNDYDHIVFAVDYRGKPVYKNGDKCVLLGDKISKRTGRRTQGINTWIAESELVPV